MKPIKFLLSLCAVLMVALGSWGQITSITAPAFTAAPVSPVCVGATLTTSAVAPTVVEAGCGANALALEIVDQATNSSLGILGTYAGAVGTPANVTGQTITIPSAAGGKTVYVRYITTASAPCNALGTASGTFTVAPVINAPVPTNAIPTICDGQTQKTAAELVVPGAFVSCTTGAPQLVSVLGTAPWNTAGSYVATFNCMLDGCVSTNTTVNFTVKATPVAPSIGTDNIPAICNGATQLTNAQLEVNGKYVSCAAGSLPVVQNGPASNTASGTVVFACVKDGCPSATLSIPYVVWFVVPGPTGVTISSNRAGATGNGTTAVSVCASSLPTPGTLTFTGLCGGNAYLIKDATGTIIGTNITTVTPPTTSTTYSVVCRDVNGCESPTSTMVTYTVTTLDAPTTVAAIPSICSGQTQLTLSQLSVNGTYVNCTAGSPYIVSIAGTAPYNTAGSYEVRYRCQTSADCFSSEILVPFTVKATPVAPAIGTSNIPPICNGATQQTISQLEVNGTYVSCGGGSVPVVQNGAPSNTASGSVVFACVKDGCTSATLSVPYVVNPIPAAPINVTLSSDRIGATGNGTTTVIACASSTPNPGTLTFVGNCAANDFVIKNSSGVVIAVNTPSITAPTAASTTYTVLCRDALGCESTGSTTVTYNIITTLPKPVATGTPIPSICDGATQLTQAQLEVNGTYANCTVGTLKVVSVAGTPPWNAAGTYVVAYACEQGGCNSDAITVSFTVKPLPVAPAIGTNNIPAICNGATQLTVAQLEVNGTYVSCGGGSVPVVQNGAPSNTASGSVVYACVKDGCSSATLSVPYVVNPIPAAPANVTISSDRIGASGNGTTAVTVCASSTPNPGTLTFVGNCAANDFVIKNAAGSVVAVNTASIAAPTAASTTYTVICRDALGCESTGSTTVTYNVTTTLPKPVATGTPIPSICDGATQLTQAQLEVNGTYANCTSGNLKVVSVAGTPPWNAAGTYVVAYACEQGGCNSDAITVSFTVKPLPVAPAIGTNNIPAICNGATQLTVAQLEVNGTYVSCGGGSVPVVQNGAPSNTTSGSVVFACVKDGCSSATLTVPYVVNLIPAAPANVTISSNRTGASGNGTTAVTVCTSQTPTPGTITFVGNCGANNFVIKNSAGADVAVNTATITAPTAASTTYTVICRDALGCESTGSTTVTYNVNTVAPPTIVTAIPTICAGQTQKTVAQLEANGVYVNCTTGSPKVLSIAGVAPWNTAGTYEVIYRCEESTTCYSTNIATSFVVNRTPTPTGAASSTLICSNVEDVDISSTGGCIAGDSVQVWSATSAGVAISKLTSGLGSTTLTTKLTNPSSTVTTPFYFVIKCKSADVPACDAFSSVITVNVRAAIPTPEASITPTSRCEADGATAMFFNSNCGTSVTKWYLQEFGGTAVATLPQTTPTTPGESVYFATCDNGTCESPRKRVVFTVYPKGSTPTSVSLTADGVTVNVNETKSVCDIAGNTISFTGCASGETILYSVDGANYTATVPTQMVDGNPHNYRIRCQAGSGASACAGAESAIMTLTIFVQPTVAPIANVTPAVVCSASPAQPFGGSSNCGVLATVWFDATTNAQLLSLPSSTSAFAPGTYSYYAKCLGAGGCLSPASAVTTLTVINNTTAPTITSIGGDEVCTGVNVTLTTNCPSGSSVVWSTGATTNALPLVANQPQVRAITAKCVITVGSTSCESPLSATKVIIWKAFDLTVINIGSSQSGVKPGAGVPKSAWAANFVTVDAGPSLQSSSQSNPSVFFTENPNKMGPRFWTIHVEACALPTTGAISYDMLATPETGVPVSFNTVENNAPYLMYANRDGFTELYAQNNPFFGFFADNGSGGNKYDTGLPKGLYKLSIRYWDQKGLGAAPATRIAQGNQLAYQEYWFRIQSQNGIGTGAAREGVGETTETEFAIATPNPVTRTLTVSINGAKGQEVKLNLVDAAGRTIKSSTVTPETNTHREEVDMTSQNTGMYFMQVSSPTKRASLKVLKVSQD